MAWVDEERIPQRTRCAAGRPLPNGVTLGDKNQTWVAVEFADQTESFSNGFALGRLFERLKATTEHTMTVTTARCDRLTVARMAGHLGWWFVFQPDPEDGANFDETTLRSVTRAKEWIGGGVKS